MIQFDELRPHIRQLMASWFFLDGMGRTYSDFQDNMVIKELNSYKSLLDALIRFRKSQIDQNSVHVKDEQHSKETQRNKIPNSDS